jgi:glycosyltransferase involved in cell wall biosynthesis
MNVSYLILNSNFIKKNNKGGQMSHAEGVFLGLKKNGICVKLYGHTDLRKFIKEANVLKKPKIDIFDIYFSYNIFKLALQDAPDYFLIRKSFSGIILFIISLKLKLIGKNIPPIIWEVNNFSNINNKVFFSEAINNLTFKLNVYVLKKSKLIYVVTNALKEKLIKHSIIFKEKTIVIPNGGPKFKGILDKSNKIIFLYFGVFKPYNNFNRIIRVFKELSSEYNEVELNFIGYGEEEKLILENSKENIKINFLGSKTLDEIKSLSLLNHKVIGIIPMEDDLSSFRSPIKMFEYISLGCPVIVSNKVPIEKNYNKDIVREYDLTDQSLKETMSYFISDKPNWEKIFNDCKSISANNSWDIRMLTLIKKINEFKK